MLLASQVMLDAPVEVEGTEAGNAAIVERAAARDEAITVGIPDFVRGPGERVDLPPNTDAGLPIVLSDGAGVRAVDLSIAYDAALLEIVGAAVEDNMPPGSGVVLNNLTPGLAVLTFYSPTDLPAGQLAFLKLHAVVPDTEFTRTLDNEHVLDLHNVTISDGDDHEFPVVDVDAIHTVAFRRDVFVSALVPTSTGFIAEFSEPIQAKRLNLIDTESAGLGPADVRLVGAVSGPVSGSVTVDPSQDWVEFVKTGGPLLPDTYEVTLRSALDGFQDLTGKPLDGDGDGTMGGDFTTRFVVETPSPDAVTLSLPDFARGPGETVDIPARATSGIPLSISNGLQVKAIDVRISYDPQLLEIQNAAAAEGVPVGSLLTANTTTPGLLILSFASPSSLPEGPVVFATLDAQVTGHHPTDRYGAIQKLDIHAATVSDGADNERQVIDDDAVHLTAYFGDVSGNGVVNAGDASLAGRVTVRLDTGFASTPLVDPLLAADISGNGRLNATDTSKIARHAAGLTVLEIPYRGNGTVERPIRWSGNGHYYSLVSPPGGIRWTDARSAAEELAFGGARGHLATVNSAAEWEFLTSTFNKNLTWIGLTDEAQEGTFRWVTGEPLEFTAWGVSPQEPNNAGGEDYVHIDYRSTGVGWNDFKNRDNVHGPKTSYLVEFPVIPEPQGPVLLQERFDSAATNPNLVGYERFVIEDGVIRRNGDRSDHNDRHYIQTTATDFNELDFRYEVTFTTTFLNQVGINYVGLGAGTRAAAYNAPADSLFLRIHTPNIDGGLAAISNRPATNLIVVGNLRTAGVHRVRIDKIGNTISFSIDAEFDGEFVADMSHTIYDLASVAPFLNSSNSRLFFGTALPDDSFDDMRIIAH